jgi:hypothetical protein
MIRAPSSSHYLGAYGFMFYSTLEQGSFKRKYDADL